MSPGDFDDIWRVTEADPNFTTELDMLAVLGPDADYSELASQMSAEHARRYVQRHSTNEQNRRLKRSAHVCANETQVAIVKMFAAYIDAWGPVKAEMRCFSELEPAIAWTEQSKGPERRIERDKVVKVLREMGQSWCCRGWRDAAAS